MKKKTTILIVAAMVVTLGCLVTACVPKTVSPAELTNPAQIFSNDCASCHKSDRTGGHGPNITASNLTKYTQTSLATFLSTHKTAKNLTGMQQVIMAGWLKAP